VVREVVELVRKKVGSVASMRDAVVVPALPKTRSGMPKRDLLSLS
jgi:acyl-coenzyme A synthetase/AMP-(fatty) acid ligase